MNTRQLNKVSMSLAVLDVMDKYEAVWSGLAQFAGIVSELDGMVAAVQEKGGLQGTRRTGLAEGKNRKQVLMIDLACAVAGDLHALATAKGDAELAAKTEFHRTDFVALADAEVGTACVGVLKLAQAHAAELAGLGTTAEDITALEAAITAYQPLVASPRVRTVETKTITEEIAALLEKIDALYELRLDRTMRKFAGKNAAFYGDYHNARAIVNLGTRHEPKVAAPMATLVPVGA